MGHITLLGAKETGQLGCYVSGFRRGAFPGDQQRAHKGQGPRGRSPRSRGGVEPGGEELQAALS